MRTRLTLLLLLCLGFTLCPPAATGQWGHVSVSSGVTVSPAAVEIGQSFTVFFTLSEINGDYRSFESIAVAILRPNGSHLFDLKTYNSITVGANGTWSRSPSGSISPGNPPGNYYAVIRGKLAGGSWFDFSVTGGGVNPRNFFVVEPTGSASVSSGVEISPSTIYASPSENFSARFTLTETMGWPITFEDVHVGITDAAGANLFDLAHFSNVTVPANGSWSYPWRGGYLDTPGSYRAYARGKVVGGDWFDFTTTGAGQNPAIITVLTAPTGFASVSSGVEISPATIYASPNENFSARFTLTETTGWPITLEDVHVGITDAAGTDLFELEHFTSVTVPAHGTWSYPWRGGYLDTPGDYRAYARGNVAGGARFDFSTNGGGANPANIVVLEPPELGFDYPVGPPDGDGYYVCQDFLEHIDDNCNHISWNGTHLGEDWNGNGLGNTDCTDPIVAIADGVVHDARYEGGCWGWVVYIRHQLSDGSELESMYAHLRTVTVGQGQSVTRGELIGTMGGSEYVCGGVVMACHLHFELRTPACRDWGDPGDGYSSDSTGWLDPSDFIDTHRVGSGGSASPVSLMQPVEIVARRTNPPIVYALPEAYSPSGPADDEKNVHVYCEIFNSSPQTLVLDDYGVEFLRNDQHLFRVSAGTPVSLDPGEFAPPIDALFWLTDARLDDGATTTIVAQVQYLSGGIWTDVDRPNAQLAFALHPRPILDPSTTGTLVKRPRPADDVDPDNAAVYLHQYGRKWRLMSAEMADQLYPGWQTELIVYPAAQVDGLADPLPPASATNAPGLVSRHLLFKSSSDPTVYIIAAEEGVSLPLRSRPFADEGAFHSYGYPAEALSEEVITITDGWVWLFSQWPLGSTIFAGIANPSIPVREFRLHGNQPNPFNPRTWIRYELPVGTLVELSVYDAAGRFVRSLVQAHREAGVHEVEWDARDASGVPVGSGVYHYRIRAGAFEETRRMVLLK